MTEKGYYEEITNLSITVEKKSKEIDDSFNNMSIEAKPINNLGLIQVSLDLGTYDSSIEHTGYITLYRSDYSSDFTKLEILKVFPYRFIGKSDKSNKIVFQDFLAVSGIPYKYFFEFSYIDMGLQIEKFSPQKETENSVVLLIEDIYLNTKDVQVQLIYNAKINSIKHNI
jgi:hypothetical protein